MRNPKRIPKVCKELEELWLKYPDLRLGQIFYNLQASTDRDIFFMEEEELMGNMRDLLK